MSTLPPVPGAYRFAAFFVKPFMWLSTRRDWQGIEHLPTQGGFIAAASHLSGIDPLTVAHFLYNAHRPPKILAKDSLFTVPGLGIIMRRTGQIPVVRGSSRAAEAVQTAESAIERGECILIFPEGTLSKDPLRWPMAGHTGVARIALATGAPVIPISQWGPHTMLPHGRHIPRIYPPTQVQVTAGPPVDLSDFDANPSVAELTRATERIMDAITELQAVQRGEQPPEKRWNPRRPGGGR